MMAYFADTAYYLALLNARDEHHAAAGTLTSHLQGSIVTTAWVLTEVADAFCRPGPRDIAAAFLRDLLADSRVKIIPPTMDLFNQGLRLFGQRPDKKWSLTDCISFIVMKQESLTEALATDDDFAQAGFVVLLK